MRLGDRPGDRALDREHAGLDAAGADGRDDVRERRHRLRLRLREEQPARSGAVCALAARVGDPHRLVPRRQQLGLALGRQSDAVLGRSVRGAGDRLVERAEAEAGGDRAADVGRVHAGPLGVGEPERQLHPGPDLVLLQELVRDPGHVGAREQLAPGDALVRRVERPGEPLLDAVHDPVGQVADVDELGEPLGRSRREDLAAAGEPPRPVGEAAGRVVRPDDQAGPDDQRALAEDRARPPPPASAFSGP